MTVLDFAPKASIRNLEADVYNFSSLSGDGIDRLTLLQHTRSHDEVPLHTHGNFYELGFLQKGSVVLETSAGNAALSAGECFIVRPHEEHRLAGIHMGLELYNFTVSAEHGAPLLRFTQEEAEFVRAQLDALPNIFQVRLLRELNELVSLCRLKETPLRGTKIALTWMRILLSIASVQPKPTDATVPHPRLDRLVEEITANPAQNYTLETMERVTNLSTSTLNRLFIAKTGFSPKQYVMRCRLKEADCLLAAGMSVSKAAESVGFRKLSHFSACYKRMFGQQPRRRHSSP